MARHGSDRSDREESALPRSSLADVLRRRGWWGVVAFLVVLTPLVALVKFLPDVYLSAATVLIERQQIPDDLVRSTVTSALEVRLQTINQEIQSRSRLEEMIARFGLYEELKREAPTEAVVEQMRKDVKIELKSGSRSGDRATVAFTVSYRGRDAQKVADVANALAGSYIEENLKMRERQAAGTADFLRGQLEELSRKLQELEAKVGDFKLKHIGELPEQLDANLKTLQQLSLQLSVNSENMTRATERRANLERELTALVGTASPTAPDSAGVRLAQLRAQLAAMETRYSDKHPDVQRLKTEIATLERGGTGASRDGTVLPQVQQIRSALLEVDVQIKGLEAEAANLKRQIALYQGRVEAVPRVQQEYQALSREYETTQEMYKSLTVRQRESALAESMEQRRQGEQFRLIEPAMPAQEPAAPKRMRLLALALLLALAAAAAAIFGPEALDTSVHTVEQLQARCELPVLVSIPLIVGPEDVRRQRHRFALATTGVTFALVGLVLVSYFLAKENWALTSRLIR